MFRQDDPRYLRQTRLPQIGSQGQEQLTRAAVLIAGAGGLGSVSESKNRTEDILYPRDYPTQRVMEKDVIEFINPNLGG